LWFYLLVNLRHMSTCKKKKIYEKYLFVIVLTKYNSKINFDKLYWVCYQIKLFKYDVIFYEKIIKKYNIGIITLSS